MAPDVRALCNCVLEAFTEDDAAYFSADDNERLAAVVLMAEKWIPLMMSFVGESCKDDGMGRYNKEGFQERLRADREEIPGTYQHVYAYQWLQHQEWRADSCVRVNVNHGRTRQQAGSTGVRECRRKSILTPTLMFLRQRSRSLVSLSKISLCVMRARFYHCSCASALWCSHYVTFLLPTPYLHCLVSLKARPLHREGLRCQGHVLDLRGLGG